MPGRGAHTVDVRSVVALVEDGRQDLRGEVLPVATLEGLFTLIGATHLSVVDVDQVTEEATSCQWLDGATERGFLGPEECQDDMFARCFPQWAIPAYQRTSGDFVTPLRWSDFYTTSAMHRHPLWVDGFRLDDKHRGLTVALPVPYPAERRIVLWRGKGADFTDRDVMVLALLRPHLHALASEVARRRQGTPALTARQQQILSLAARGLSNAEIARTLVISAATVRKHVENAMARTGTHTRVAAALTVPDLPVVTGSGPRRTALCPPRSMSPPR